MAYVEETAATPDEVIDKIVNFAQVHGWTVHRNSLVGSNRIATVRKGGDYIHLWNTDAEDVRITGSVGYDPAQAPGSGQPNWAGCEARANILIGPYTRLYLFTDNTPAEHIHCVVEMQNGVFRCVSFGLLDKLGVWTGGTYFDATYWYMHPSYVYKWANDTHHVCFEGGRSFSLNYHGAVRCDADSTVNRWLQMDSDQTVYARTSLRGGSGNSPGNSNDGHSYLTTQCYYRNNPPFSGQVTLGRIRVDAERTGGFFSMAGTYPNVRYLSMERFAPGQEITVGTDVWKVFPMCRKGEGSNSSSDPRYGEPYSDNHAFAFKKVA